MGLALLAPGTCAVLAQTRTLADIASDTAPDRMQRLAADARKEGSLSLYTSRVAEDTTPVTDAFTKKYGVAVQVWRASNQNIIQRAVVESRAGRCPADVISSGTPALEPLYREQLLQPVKSPDHQRADAAGAAAPRRMGRHQREHHLGRLQHRSGQAAGRAQEL